MSANTPAISALLRVRRLAGHRGTLSSLLRHYGIILFPIRAGRVIPFSYWGGREAGLRRQRLYARGDTPLHSVLHEAGHLICMDRVRRRTLKRDAGGDVDEENAVNRLAAELAACIPGYGTVALLKDMDRWGYTFRLGSARAWYEQESAPARDWLQDHALLRADGRLRFRARLHRAR